jgi:hypothetical protein
VIPSASQSLRVWLPPQWSPLTRVTPYSRRMAANFRRRGGREGRLAGLLLYPRYLGIPAGDSEGSLPHFGGVTAIPTTIAAITAIMPITGIMATIPAPAERSRVSAESGVTSSRARRSAFSCGHYMPEEAPEETLQCL